MKVKELYVHPIKSCKPIRVKSAEIGEFGFINDRRWMIITQDNRYQGLKHNPKFALIDCAIDETGMPELKLTIRSDDEIGKAEVPFEVELFKEKCEVVEEGKQAAEWFTEFLVAPENKDKLKLRLVRNFTKNIKRPSESKLAGADSVIMFADAFPVLVVSQASQDNLNTKLKAPISVARFRPNIVVDGPESFPQDEWQEIKINSIPFKVAEQCARCKVPTATENGTYDKDNDPTTTLKTYRAIKHNVFFGNYFFQLQRGTISEGDEIEVIKSGPWVAMKEAQQTQQTV